MNMNNALARWHEVARNGSTVEGLRSIIHDDAVFHSPVVHTPQVGQAIVIAYLSAAAQTLGNESFCYVREVLGENTAVLEFTTQMDGIHINGIDMITFNEDEMIIDFKVMVRPLKAVNKVWEMMAAQLERAPA
ncbi:MAG: nuclear transport factor 2 family protein [Erythrobacter sp.]|nr:nuclear transport factor 2 family protein [Erythrobacter sp.]